MRSKMSIRVEFLAGTELRDALIQAKRFAAKHDLVYTIFSFNGKSFSIGENASIEEAISQYHSDFGTDKSVVLA